MDQPILVVGGRTTGIFMAAELARHGVPVRIIDASPGVDPHSRATYLRARTLEILHGLDLADEIVAGGQPLHAVRIYADGKHVLTTPELPVDSPFPWGAAYAQSKTERVLERHLDGLGVSIERSTQLLGLRETSEGISATIQGPDGKQEIMETPWLIGCDGSHSVVRKQVEDAFPGVSDPHPMLACDVVVEGEIDPAVAYLCLTDEGDLFFFLLDEGRRQVIATLPRGSSRTTPPTLEEMQRLVDERGFTDLRLSDSRWMTLFHTHYRLAPRYRHGRVFLAGDAAHIHSFIGGQGMNTGIQDAHNLAWKLAMVLRHGAPESWLDSYETERRRIAEDVLEWTKAATDQLTEYSDLSPSERERLVEHMSVPENERLSFRAHEEEIDLDYRTSPLCLDRDGQSAGPRAGSRAPDASPLRVEGSSTSLLRVLSGPRYHVLSFPSSLPDESDRDGIAAIRSILRYHGDWLRLLVVDAAQPAWSEDLEATRIKDTEGELKRIYGGDAADLYLIRPDGYVAFRSRSLIDLNDYLAHVGMDSIPGAA